MRRLNSDDRIVWIRLSNKREKKRLKRSNPRHNRRKLKKPLATPPSYVLNPYLTHTINSHLKTICCVIKNLRVALHPEK